MVDTILALEEVSHKNVFVSAVNETVQNEENGNHVLDMWQQPTNTVQPTLKRVIGRRLRAHGAGLSHTVADRCFCKPLFSLLLSPSLLCLPSSLSLLHNKNKYGATNSIASNSAHYVASS